MKNSLPKVVIIGAGFGGIAMAKYLKNKPVDVLLIDQNNFHNFQPLMYQIATGGLEPYSIAYPVRRIFRSYKNVRFRMATVEKVIVSEKKLETSIGDINYDYLIIATGSKNNYFNFEDIKDKLLTLKSIPDALDMRSFIFQNLEKALSNDTRDLDEVLNVAIVGGGPAGIELAGALAEMRRYVIPKDFPELDTSKMNIHLYEAGKSLLSGMSHEASEKALKFVEDLDVKVFLETKVNEYDGKALKLSNNEKFKTDTVIWTAGVKGAPIKGLPDDVIVGGNRIKVDAFNRVEGTDSIFAIGDVAAHITDKNPKGLPMLAPVAQQHGKHLAKNIIRMTKDKTPKPFRYFDKGTMATIGRKKAVVDLPKWKFQGTFAWFVWMFVHIMSLVGFRNKLVALVNWTLGYFTYDKPLGLIIRRFRG